MRKAFSVVEVVLATALFAVFSTGVTVAVLSGLNLNRSGLEQIVASQYAVEGMEAVRSIKNQNFNNLTSGNWAVATTSGQWALVTPGPDNTVFDKYTRGISISDVSRDGAGNIVETGNPDSDTKKVTVTVSWYANSVRSLSSVLTTYMTNWRLPSVQSSPTPTTIPGATATPTTTPMPPTATPTSTPVPPTSTPTNTPIPVSTPTPTPSTCAGWSGTCRTSCLGGETNRSKLNCTGKNFCCSL